MGCASTADLVSMRYPCLARSFVNRDEAREHSAPSGLDDVYRISAFLTGPSCRGVSYSKTTRILDRAVRARVRRILRLPAASDRRARGALGPRRRASRSPRGCPAAGRDCPSSRRPRLCHADAGNRRARRRRDRRRVRGARPGRVQHRVRGRAATQPRGGHRVRVALQGRTQATVNRLGESHPTEPAVVEQVRLGLTNPQIADASS